MADQPDITQLPTNGAPIGSPTSGTYGEGVALERLQSDLPGMDPQSPGGPAPLPPMGPGPVPPPAPPGLPGALLAPTANPTVPASTPLQAPQPIPQQPTAQRIMMLETLRDTAQSEETREWAAMTLNKIIRSARA